MHSYEHLLVNISSIIHEIIYAHSLHLLKDSVKAQTRTHSYGSSPAVWDSMFASQTISKQQSRLRLWQARISRTELKCPFRAIRPIGWHRSPFPYPSAIRCKIMDKALVHHAFTGAHCTHPRTPIQELAEPGWRWLTLLMRWTAAKPPQSESSANTWRVGCRCWRVPSMT